MLACQQQSTIGLSRQSRVVAGADRVRLYQRAVGAMIAAEQQMQQLLLFISKLANLQTSPTGYLVVEMTKRDTQSVSDSGNYRRCHQLATPATWLATRLSLRRSSLALPCLADRKLRRVAAAGLTCCLLTEAFRPVGRHSSVCQQVAHALLPIYTCAAALASVRLACARSRSLTCARQAMIRTQRLHCHTAMIQRCTETVHLPLVSSLNVFVLQTQLCMH